MPVQPINDGQVSDMVKNYPALTVRTAQRAMERAGMDPSDPNLAMQMVGSSKFKEEAAETINARGDLNAIQGQTQRAPNLPDLNAPLNQRTTDLFTERENFQRGQSRASGILASRIFEATQKASKLADFNETAFKTKRLKELDPTSDLDNQIMKLRFRQMKEEADIRSNPRFSHLSPAAKQRLIDTNRNEARETVDGLREMRNARLQAAESRVDEEIASHNQIISRAKSRITDLKAAEEMLEKSGESTETLFDIREKRQKAERDMAKQKKGGGGDASWEVILQYILEDVQRDGTVVTSEIEKNAKIQAKAIANKMSNFKGNAGREGAIRTATAGAASLITGDDVAPLNFSE